MASSSTTGGSTNSDQEDQTQLQLVNQRKRKRMQSNRESARRSRMRKQKLLDDLLSQVGQLKKENGQIITSVSITTQLLVNLEAENSILRAQMAELTNRLQSLNDIMNCISSTSNCLHDDREIRDDHNHDTEMMMMMMMNVSDLLMNPWNASPLNPPIMASADHNQMYMY